MRAGNMSVSDDHNIFQKEDIVSGLQKAFSVFTG